VPRIGKISPCLWFDDQAEAAARFYVSIFDNSAIGTITRYGKEGFEIHGRPEGSVLTVRFRLDGQDFTALNGGPHFKFNEAVSLVVACDSQDEIDRYWDKLGAGGDPKAQRCGWLKDQYGLSWQVVPAGLDAMLADKDRARVDRVFKAILQMRKLELPALKRAFDGS
jgi:predicted 3-demethylubiquinone-9 3-methyltransferase (glyoxalase superfamily)